MNQQEAIEAAKALPWAKWVAQDLDMHWHAYDQRPQWGHGAYLLPEPIGQVAWLGEGSFTPGPLVEIRP